MNHQNRSNLKITRKAIFYNENLSLLFIIFFFQKTKVGSLFAVLMYNLCIQISRVFVQNNYENLYNLYSVVFLIKEIALKLYLSMRLTPLKRKTLTMS